DLSVRLWQVASGKQLRSLGPAAPPNPEDLEILLASMGRANLFSNMAFSGDGKALVTVSRDNSLALWEVATGKERFRFKGNQSLGGPLLFSPDGKLLVTGGDEVIRLWDALSGKVKRVLLAPQGSASALAFSPSGKLLAAGYDDGAVRL